MRSGGGLRTAVGPGYSHDYYKYRRSMEDLISNRHKDLNSLYICFLLYTFNFTSTKNTAQGGC